MNKTNYCNTALSEYIEKKCYDFIELNSQIKNYNIKLKKIKKYIFILINIILGIIIYLTKFYQFSYVPYYIVILIIMNIIFSVLLIDNLKNYFILTISNIILIILSNKIVEKLTQNYRKKQYKKLYNKSELYITLEKLKKEYLLCVKTKDKEKQIQIFDLIDETIELINKSNYKFLDEYKYLLQEYKKIN